MLIARKDNQEKSKSRLALIRLVTHFTCSACFVEVDVKGAVGKRLADHCAVCQSFQRCVADICAFWSAFGAVAGCPFNGIVVWGAGGSDNGSLQDKWSFLGSSTRHLALDNITGLRITGSSWINFLRPFTNLEMAKESLCLYLFSTPSLSITIQRVQDLSHVLGWDYFASLWLCTWNKAFCFFSHRLCRI